MRISVILFYSLVTPNLIEVLESLHPNWLNTELTPVDRIIRSNLDSPAPLSTATLALLPSPLKWLTCKHISYIDALGGVLHLSISALDVPATFWHRIDCNLLIDVVWFCTFFYKPSIALLLNCILHSTKE